MNHPDEPTQALPTPFADEPSDETTAVLAVEQPGPGPSPLVWIASAVLVLALMAGVAWFAVTTSRQNRENAMRGAAVGYLQAVAAGDAAGALAQLAEQPASTTLLTDEARLTKALFKLAADTTRYGEFTRAKRGTGTDAANRVLDHGNYLAYGLGATATWVLGLPHGLAVLHGKTRRGGLVFDAADLVKDAAILPQAFLSAMRGDDEQAFRRACIEALTRSESLDFMIDSLKEIAMQTARLATTAAGDGGCAP